jgi:pimeloyl-ACP methyl ester carboxylesterase
VLRAIIVLGLAATLGVAAEPTAARPAVPSFVRGACPSLAVKLIPAIRKARCGVLVVPENRAKPTGPTIRLPVALVPARSHAPARDPVVFLAGGPGGSAIGQAQLLVETGFNRDRELVLMDQRGTMLTSPSVQCPEIDRFAARSLALVYDAASTGRLHVAATRACYRRLRARGMDLGAYNTTESAADYADLRTALSIDEWNVFGVSYGTDLALTLMREHPQGIRSVTLDSVTPPQTVSLGRFWGNLREGFDSLFGACAAQQRCRARHPELAKTFTRLVRKLEARPLTTRVRPPTGGPTRKVVLDGGALVNWLVGAALNNTLRTAPAFIDDLANGHPQQIAASWAPGAGSALIYGVACSEWVPYERPSDVLRRGRRAFPRYPASVLAQPPQVPFLTEDCRVWRVPKAPAAQRAVTHSTIPTLILTGSLDSVTPPSWGRIAARTLPNSTFVTIPGAGHFVLPVSRCAQHVFASFLAIPAAPNTSCVARLHTPAFK